MSRCFCVIKVKCSGSRSIWSSTFAVLGVGTWFLSVIPMANSEKYTVNCQHALDEDLLVVECTLEMVIASPQLSKR